MDPVNNNTKATGFTGFTKTFQKNLSFAQAALGVGACASVAKLIFSVSQIGGGIITVIFTSPFANYYKIAKKLQITSARQVGAGFSGLAYASANLLTLTILGFVVEMIKCYRNKKNQESVEKQKNVLPVVVSDDKPEDEDAALNKYMNGLQTWLSRKQGNALIGIGPSLIKLAVSVAEIGLGSVLFLACSVPADQNWGKSRKYALAGAQLIGGGTEGIVSATTNLGTLTISGMLLKSRNSVNESEDLV